MSGGISAAVVVVAAADVDGGVGDFVVVGAAVVVAGTVLDSVLGGDARIPVSIFPVSTLSVSKSPVPTLLAPSTPSLHCVYVRHR